MAEHTESEVMRKNHRGDARSESLSLGRIFALHPGWLALLAALGLTLLGWLCLDVAVAALQMNSDLAMRQLIFLPVALVGMVVISLLPSEWLARMSFILLGISIVLLMVLLIPGMPQSIVPVKNGARRWFDLQVILFQPSELTKIAYVLAMASYLRFRKSQRQFRGLMMPALLTLVPMALIVVEPDLGTALIFAPTFLVMILASGARLRHIALIVLAAAIFLPASYPMLKPHQQARIKALVFQIQGDTRYQHDIGYQGFKAMTLVGAGGLTGHPRDHAVSLIRYNRLPEPHNDMIFAVLCVRYGALGAAAMIMLYLMLIGAGVWAAIINRNPFTRLMAAGAVSIIMTQLVVNVGMTIGLLPITGMTLPFISYGGSSLVANYLLVGLVFHVAIRQPRRVVRENFDTPVEPPYRPWPIVEPMAATTYGQTRAAKDEDTEQQSTESAHQ